MIRIAPHYRAFLGGLVAGVIGVAVFAGANASADPLQPPPAPAVPAQVPAPQNVTAAPGGVNGNRIVATPPAANPFTAPPPASAPAAQAPAAVAPGAPMPPTVTPAVSGTIREYLQSKGVRLEAQKPQGLKALDITLPVPTRWTQVPDPNVPDAFAVIADRYGNSVYTSNAQVVVYKLVGNFDPREAITHGYVDSQKLLVWQTTNVSMADFGGFPSSIIEGTYRDGDVTVNTSRRNVIATSGRDKYLVSLAVNTDRAVAVADAPATDAIINGFRVTVPGAAAPAPAQGPGAAPVGLPAQTPGAAPVGLPAQTPAAAPVGLPAQTPAAAPVGLPAQTPPPNQVGASQPKPNLLTLVPGLPPLPNFAFLQGR
jgi:Probable lipoprotein LpqN